MDNQEVTKLKNCEEIVITPDKPEVKYKAASALQIIRKSISDDMVMFGIIEFIKCQDEIENGREISISDQVCRIYAAMQFQREQS